MTLADHIQLAVLILGSAAVITRVILWAIPPIKP